MRLYLDSSALVKRYVREHGSSAVVTAMDRADAWLACRIAYVEASRAIAAQSLEVARELGRFRSDWTFFEVVEIDAELSESAAALAIERRLRSLDALHLAAGLAARGNDLVFATWDARLWGAAREAGLALLPERL